MAIDNPYPVLLRTSADWGAYSNPASECLYQPYSASTHFLLFSIGRGQSVGFLSMVNRYLAEIENDAQSEIAERVRIFLSDVDWKLEPCFAQTKRETSSVFALISNSNRELFVGERGRGAETAYHTTPRECLGYVSDESIRLITKILHEWVETPDQTIESERINRLRERTIRRGGFGNKRLRIESHGFSLLPNDNDTRDNESFGFSLIHSNEEITDTPLINSDYLLDKLLNLSIDRQWPEVCECIFLAEDTVFSSSQADKLSRRLIDIAAKKRNSSKPDDEDCIWTAIRKGASMLGPQDAQVLIPLLEPGYGIETSLVTLKMIGRVFEAQPPIELDQYEVVAAGVHRFVELLVNSHVIATGGNRCAASAQLAIYALATMGSSRILDAVSRIGRLRQQWFQTQVLWELRDLRTSWTSPECSVGAVVLHQLSSVISDLESALDH